MSAGSYVTSSFSQSITDEIKRLGIQVDLFWGAEKSIYEDFSLPPGARVLEVGSGPGFYIKKLAETFPDANFVSLEYDQKFSEYQHELFEGELSNRVEIIHGDVLSIEGLKDFDMVVSRMVLEHLPEPEKAFDRMGSFLKDGGRFVLLDNDFTNHLRTYPRVDELGELYKAYCRARVEQGGNPYIGRELPKYFQLAGYKDVHFQTISTHTYKVDKSLFLGAESSAIGMTLVEQGYLDQGTFKRLVTNWSKMAHNPDNVMMREFYCAHGVKTEATTNVEFKQESNEVAAPRKTTPLAMSNIQDFSLPETEREMQIAGVWCDLLNVETVPADVSFFDIGGESYLVPLVAEALENEHQIEIEIIDLFEYPSISKLASFLDSKESEASQATALGTAPSRAEEKESSDNPFARLKKKS